MIVLASYLALYGMFVPHGAELIGPLKPSVCKELRLARRHAGLDPEGQCITLNYPKDSAR